MKMMSIDNLVKIAINYLTNTDVIYFGLVYNNLPKEITCVVSVTDCKNGFTRVKVLNTDESYYYVPSIMFEGKRTWEAIL